MIGAEKQQGGFTVKSKIKTIAAALLLTLNSVMSWPVFVYAYLSVGGAIYSVETNRFDAESLFFLLFGLQTVANFAFVYVPSIIYLSKQMYQIKKWMVIIPILVSVLLGVFGFVLALIMDVQIIAY